MALPAVTYRDFHVVFKGDQVGRIEDADEILIGDCHYTGQDQGLELNRAFDVVRDHDAFFLEGVPLFSRLHTFDVMMGSDLPTFSMFGWDYNESGEEISTVPPKYWQFFERESELRHQLKNERDPGVQAQLKQKLAHYLLHPQRGEFRAKALANWDKRQESLRTALEITGNLRPLNGKTLRLDGKAWSLDPGYVFRRTVIQSGLSHVVKNPMYPELAPSIDRLYGFLKNRNAVVLVPKSLAANREFNFIKPLGMVKKR